MHSECAKVNIGGIPREVYQPVAALAIDTNQEYDFDPEVDSASPHEFLQRYDVIRRH